MGSVVAGVTNSVSITSITSGLTVPSSAQSVITANVGSSASGTTVYTVTAGKTFYCTGILITNMGAGAAELLFKLDGTSKFAFLLPIGTGASGTSSFYLGGGILFTLAATKAITVTGGTFSCTVTGFEQ